jgi:hypothetical protein
MGMFDNVRCKLPLPWPEAADFDAEWQTKDLDCQLDLYEIREDGTLWHEDYDTEDRSDPNAEGLNRFCGMRTRVNKRWEQMQFEGELCFYHLVDPPNLPKLWYEVKLWFKDGRVADKICDKRPSNSI